MSIKARFKRLPGIKQCRGLLLSAVPYGAGSHVLSKFLGSPLGLWMFRQTLDDLRRLKIQSGKKTERDYLLNNCALLWRLKAFSNLSAEAFNQHTTFENLAILEDALNRGKGVILVNFHFGATRLIPLAMSRKGFPLSSIEAADALEEIQAKHRENLKVIEVGAGQEFLLKQLIAAKRLLGKGGILHMVPDGLQGKGGIELPFHGKQRRFASSFAELALDSGASVIPVHAKIAKTGHLSIHLCPPLNPGNADQDHAERVHNLVNQYATLLADLWQEDKGGIRSIHLKHFQRLPDSGSTS